MLIASLNATLCYFVFDGRSNVCIICHHFRYIRHRNRHDLDLDNLNGPRSNLTTLIERPYWTSYFLATARFATSVTVCEIFAVELCMTLTLIFTSTRSNVNMSIEMSYMTSYLMAIIVFALSVTVCVIITYELPNILDSSIWPWKWRSTSQIIFIQIGRKNYFVNVHMCIKIGASKCSRLHLVHFVTYVRTYGNAYCLES